VRVRLFSDNKDFRRTASNRVVAVASSPPERGGHGTETEQNPILARRGSQFLLKQRRGPVEFTASSRASASVNVQERR